MSSIGVVLGVEVSLQSWVIILLISPNLNNALLLERCFLFYSYFTKMDVSCGFQPRELAISALFACISHLSDRKWSSYCLSKRALLLPSFVHEISVKDVKLRSRSPFLITPSYLWSSKNKKMTKTQTINKYPNSTS